VNDTELKKLEAKYRSRTGFDPDVTLPPKAAPVDLPEYTRRSKAAKIAKAEAQARKVDWFVTELDEYRDLLKRVAKARAIQRELNRIENKPDGYLTPWPDLPRGPENKG
jgi:hypothetical protein